MVFRVSDVEDGDPALAIGADADPTLALDDAASEEDRGWLELQVEAQLDDAELESDMAGSRKWTNQRTRTTANLGLEHSLA